MHRLHRPGGIHVLLAVGITLVLEVHGFAQARGYQVGGVDTDLLCPANAITDTLLFKNIKDSGKRLFLPRYRTAVQTVSGNPQYRVRLFKQGSTTILEIFLEKYAARELGDTARTAKEVPHEIQVLLRFVDEQKRNRELKFQEVTSVLNGLKAVFRAENLQDRDSMLHALEDPRLEANLVVPRTLIARRYPQDLIESVKKEIKDIKDSWFPSKERLARAEKYLNQLKTEGLPAQVTQDSIEPPRPFAFDRKLHPYIFAGITDSAAAQLVREQVEWQSRFYSYFRPADVNDRWYYLPDRFELSKKNQLPALSVQFTGPPEAQSVELEYVAVPVTEKGRIEAAKVALGLGTAKTVAMEPLVAKEASLWARLPGASASGPFERRSGASVDLRAGLKDELKLTIEGFQKIYAALFTDSHILFSSEVRLNPDGVTQEIIPFEARVTDISPEAFWDKAISPLVLADYQRTIQVKTTASVFAGDVKTLIVRFKESDDDVALLQDKLESKAIVKMPMKEFILNTGNGGEYHYKVTAVRQRNGKFETTEMASWRKASDAILYPQVP